MTDVTLEYEIRFDNKFSKAEEELDALRVEIDLKKHYMFFGTHVYSKQELLNSPRVRKVHAITGKIGDDVLQWLANNALPDEGKDVYVKRRNRIQRRLRLIYNKIQSREPTWCEQWLGVFESMGRTIMVNLPTVAELVRRATRLLPGTEDADTPLLPS